MVWESAEGHLWEETVDKLFNYGMNKIKMSYESNIRFAIITYLPLLSMFIVWFRSPLVLYS